jgi:hypothetical protein
VVYDIFQIIFLYDVKVGACCFTHGYPAVPAPFIQKKKPFSHYPGRPS